MLIPVQSAITQQELEINKKIQVTKGKHHSVFQDMKSRTRIDFDNDSEMKVSHHVYNKELVEILGKDKTLKTQLDCDILRMAFIKINFFQDLERQMSQELVHPLYKELFYERMKPKQIVFNLGEQGRKFYIILKGSVWVLVKKRGLQDGTLPTKEEIKAEDDEKRQIIIIEKLKVKKPKIEPTNSLFLTVSKVRKERRSLAGPFLNLEEEEIVLTDAQYIEKNFPYFTQVGTMVAGDSFGEIALSKQIPRTATIVCNEETHFVSLTRDAFNKLLSEYYHILQQVNVKLLKQVSMFADWNEAMLNQLYYHFTFKTFSMNQTIYKENDDSNEIYLVKEGEVEISRMLQIKTKEPSESEKLLANFVISSDRYSSKTRRIKQAIITAGQVFGQEEVIEGCNRKSMALCVSDNVQLFILDKQRFLTSCLRGNALDKIKESSYVKKQWRSLNSDTFSIIGKPQIQTNVLNGQFKDYLLNKRLTKQEKFINNSLDQSSLNKGFSNFVVPKAVNIVSRVGDKITITASKLLQEKTHTNSAVENFTFNFDQIMKTVKPFKMMTISSGFFDLDSGKVSTSQLSTKSYPKLEPKRVNHSTDHLIKHLRLPSILKYIDTKSQTKDQTPAKKLGDIVKSRKQIN